MITLKDYENLLKYFEEHEIPEELKNMIEKLKVMREEILYRQEAQDKIKSYQNRLAELSANDKEED